MLAGRGRARGLPRSPRRRRAAQQVARDDRRHRCCLPTSPTRRAARASPAQLQETARRRRHRRAQRRHHARQDARAHAAESSGTRCSASTSTRSLRITDALLDGRAARRRPHHQPVVDRRHRRQHRPDQLRRVQGGRDRLHARRSPASSRTRGITVNAIAPGFIETRHDRRDPGGDPRGRAAACRRSARAACPRTSRRRSRSSRRPARRASPGKCCACAAARCIGA